MKNVTFVNFVTKTVQAAPVERLRVYELELIKTRINEISDLLDCEPDEDIADALNSELAGLEARLEESLLLAQNEERQRALIGKRRKNQRPKIAV